MSPVSVVNLDTVPSAEIIPVIFIKEAVFTDMAAWECDTLAARIYRLINEISKHHNIRFNEVQFDCDWTKRSQSDYFTFLALFKSRFNCRVTATIRLHQVKYPESMGIPPVDKGILMFYNMGKIGADTVNSIYDKRTAARYTAYLNKYPLPLDLALPVFGWNIQLRDGKVEELLNKTITADDLNDTSFVSLQGTFYTLKNDGFRKGFYFKKGDQIKREFVSGEQLLDIAKSLSKSMRKPAELIFYDLDSVNLKQYDTKIFQEISNCFN